MPDPNPDFEAILKTLTKAEVDFIIVGRVCAVLHGAPVSTFDLDLVYSRTGHNLARLEKALQELTAVYREKSEVSPDASLLENPGHHLFMTRYGPSEFDSTAISLQKYVS